MTSNVPADDGLGTLSSVKADCRKWRHMVARSLRNRKYVLPATDEKYQVIHGRILASCDDLAGQPSCPEIRRQAIRQLEELLRPWSSAKALTTAPRDLVDDLVRKETSLELRLGGKRRGVVVRRLMRLVIVACLAALAAVLTRTEGYAALAELVLGLPTVLAAYYQRLSAPEYFVIAAFGSWLIGMWLLSHVYKS